MSLLPDLTFLRRIRRRVLLHRRALAALLAGCAVLVGLRVAAPPPPHTVPVWTAARDLPGGHVVERADLRRVRFPPDTAPSRTAPAADLLGRPLAGPVVQGAVLTPTAVVGADLAAAHPGLTAVPTRISDPEAARLLRVGDRIDLLATDPEAPGEARVLVEDALVLARPDSPSGPSPTTLSGHLIVLGVTPEAVGQVVAAQVTAFVSPVWTG